MDQIAVADIPLPNEELDYKSGTQSQNPVSEKVLNSNQIISDNLKTTEENNPIETIETTIEKNENKLEISETNQKVETENQIETKNENIVVEIDKNIHVRKENDSDEVEIREINSKNPILEPENSICKLEIEIDQTQNCIEIQENLVLETEDQSLNVKHGSFETDDNQLELQETENIAGELLQEVTLDNPGTIPCITNTVVSETIEELQMEVEQVLSHDRETVESVKENLESESGNKLKSLKQMIDEADIVMDTDETSRKQVVEQQSQVQITEVKEISEIDNDFNEENVNNEKPKLIIEEMSKEEKSQPTNVDTSEKPAKVVRSNSTIEAIKNDWADSLTIEEINEDMAIVTSSALPKLERVITEPDKIEDIHAESQMKNAGNDVNITIVASETTNNEIIGTVANDVIIEIIDSDKIIVEGSEINNKKRIDNLSVCEETVKIDKPLVESVKKGTETKEQHKSVNDEIVNNNEAIENPSTETKKLEEKNVKTRGVRSSQRLTTKDGRLQIPCHVLGRNVDNPTEDLTSNGRAPPKPRLGVKVPYRFLTSQIVTKEEIANELIQLTSKRNPDRDPPAGGDIFFANKLTQRLASKIALNAHKKKPQSNEKTNESTSGIPTEALNIPPTIASGSKVDTIADNSDLLAILEGDVDVDLTKELRNTKTNESAIKISGDSRKLGVVNKKLDPELERELALKQLSEMPPKKDNRGRPRKYRIFETKTQYVPIKQSSKPKETIKSVAVEITKVKKEQEQILVQTSTSIKGKVDHSTNENIKQAASKIAKKLKETEKLTLKDDKEKQINDLNLENDLLEPNLTPKRVTKTYSRREAVLNVPDDLELIVNESETLSALTEESDVKKEICELVTTSKTSDLKKSKQKDSDNSIQKKNEQNNIRRKSKRMSTEINKPEIMLVSKRARIIKRKVIWDPAEVPKTKVLNAIRRAQALELKARKQQMKAKRDEEEDEEEEEDDEEDEEDEETENEKGKEIEKKVIVTDDVNDTKQEEVQKVQKQEDKINQENKQKQTEETYYREIRTRRSKKILPRATLKVKKAKKMLMKRQLRSLGRKNIRSTNGELKSSLVLSRKKKQVIAEIAKSVKPKKTELDRLLGDEGAVNMLYSVRQTNIRGKTQKTVSQKELLNRTKVIKDVIITQSNNNDDTTKALRKKESPTLPPIQIPPRKKSRDSIRSSLQSPPPSPSYYHPHRAEASRIIRRHSSSFSSDCSSPRRLSIDQQLNENKQDTSEDTSKTDFQSPIRILRRKCIIEKKPEECKEKKKSEEKESEIKNEKEKLSVAEKRKLSVEMGKVFDKTPKKKTRSSKGEEEEAKEESQVEIIEKEAKETDTKTKPRFLNVHSDFKEIQLKKSNYFYQIVMFSSNSAKQKNIINVQMLHELNSVLTKLAKDDSCRVVALTSNGSFCNGIDFSNLIQTNAEKRLIVAQELAKYLMEFIKILARFPKPIIAAVQGSAKFLGCTILPYFDVVLCSDLATFGAPYYQLGQCPEGAPGLTLSRSVFTELLMFGRKFTAQEALDNGLVNKLEKKELLTEATLKVGCEFAEKSCQFMMTTKLLLRQAMLQKLDEALELEQKLLIEHWTSSECQQNFKKLLQDELW